MADSRYPIDGVPGKAWRVTSKMGWRVHPVTGVKTHHNGTDIVGKGKAVPIKAAFDGSIKGGNFLGTTGLADYHDLASAVPADVQSKVAEVVAGLKDGSIQTGVKIG